MLDIPPAYPFRAPEVTCTARIWHPNIDTGNGRVELDILNKDWRPVLSINTVVFALQVSGRDSAAVEASGIRRSAEPSVHAFGGGGGLCSLPKHSRETHHGATRTPNKSRQSSINLQRFSTTYHTPVAALSRAEPRQRDQQRRRAHPAHRPGIVREPGATDPPRRFLLRTCVRTERRPHQRRGQPADAGTSNCPLVPAFEAKLRSACALRASSPPTPPSPPHPSKCPTLCPTLPPSNPIRAPLRSPTSTRR